MIKINDREFQYRESMTVEEALKLSGERVDTMDIIVVNGEIISKKNISKTTINDNTIIQLLPLISGG